MSMPDLKNLPTSFRTPRLMVRAYRAGDGPMYFAVGQRNRAHLQRYEAMNSVLKPKDAVEAEALIAEYIEDWEAGRYFLLGAFALDTGAFVAQIYIGTLNWSPPEFEVGYFVDHAFEGQGYVSEALDAAKGFIFNDLGATRLRLECADSNTRSMRVAERGGFIYTAYLKDNHQEPDGSFSSSRVYELRREAYMAQSNPGSGQ